MAAVYDKNYGQILGGAQPQYDQSSANYGGNPLSPPSWGYIPSSMQSTLLMPQSQGGMYPYDTGISQDSYPEAFTEYTQDRDKRKKKKEKKTKRKREDAKTAVEWLLFLGMFNTVMWVIPIFGNGWHERMFMGFGVNFTKVSTSLLGITIEVECHGMKWGLGIDWSAIEKMNPDQAVCKVFKGMSGTHSMQDAKDLACSVSTLACNTMASIWYASFFLIFAYGVSALGSFIGAMFLWFYWYQEHLAKIRKWAMALYMISPAFGVISFAIYNILCPDLGELPRSWTAKVASINQGTGFGEIKPIGDDSVLNRFGWCWFLSYITFAFAIAAPVSWGMWFKKHYDEEQHEMDAMNEQWELEDAVEEIATKQDWVESGYDPAAYNSQATGIHGVELPQKVGQTPYGYGGGAGYGSYPQGQMYPGGGMISY